MDRHYRAALILGYERMAAWSDLLDLINVYPVADADTGRNLKISLAPLRQLDETPEAVPRYLMKAATGNSGNIAVAYLQELLNVDGAARLSPALQTALQKARKAVVDPKPGTMLTLFETLSEAAMSQNQDPVTWRVTDMVNRLAHCVEQTVEALPELQQAGVVDAGALGMFIFFEAFLNGLVGRTDQHLPVIQRFQGKLAISDDYQPADLSHQDSYCVSARLQFVSNENTARRRLGALGRSVVVSDDGDGLKVHLHTNRRTALRAELEQVGRVLDWSEEKIEHSHAGLRFNNGGIHIMTDAAGSITAQDAHTLGITLLNSYLVVGEQAWPETLYLPEKLYTAMKSGTRVSTAQASMFERHQSYLSVVSRYEKVLYLCVGSIYTGNFETATAWKAQNDGNDRLTVIDTGFASGRLGIVVLATARFAEHCEDAETVIGFAREAVAQSQELVFLDQLKFLAAGGRISKTKGFFGDLLHKKPIITPAAKGAEKVGIVRNRQEQLDFALERLSRDFRKQDAPFILMQYSDNQDWVEKSAAEKIQRQLPAAQIVFRPLSLTSGAHMGPGTWAMAYLPAFNASI